MRNLIILSFLLSGCASKLTFDQAQDYCMELGMRRGVPYDSRELDSRINVTSNFEYGWESGFSTGWYHGCFWGVYK